MEKRRLPGYLAAMCMALALIGCGGKTTVREDSSIKEAAEAEAGIIENTESMESTEIQEKEEEQGRRQRLEAFAETIQEAVADRDLEALSELLAYPCVLKTADGESLALEKPEDLLKQNPDLVFGDDLMIAVANVDTADLDETETGVVLGEGAQNIIFTECADGSLGITEINE